MWFPECPLFGGKNALFGTKDSVRCSEFGGGRFSEVANVWDFQSVTRALSALGSVSASRSARSGSTVLHCCTAKAIIMELFSQYDSSECTWL